MGICLRAGGGGCRNTTGRGLLTAGGPCLRRCRFPLIRRHPSPLDAPGTPIPPFPKTQAFADANRPSHLLAFFPPRLSFLQPPPPARANMPLFCTRLSYVVVSRRASAPAILGKSAGEAITLNLHAVKNGRNCWQRGRAYAARTGKGWILDYCTAPLPPEVLQVSKLCHHLQRFTPL